MTIAVWLLVTVCGSNACNVRQLAWDGSLMACNAQAQGLLAASLPPGVTVRAWRCVAGDPA